MTDIYIKGQTARVTATFLLAGVPTDPTTITLTVTDPSANQDVYTYALGQVTRSSAGVYYKDIPLDENGRWYDTWVGTGTVVATYDHYLDVGIYDEPIIEGRIYCTMMELMEDLEAEEPWDETRLLRYMRSASAFIDRRLGLFIPVIETRQFDGNGERELFIDPCLAIDSLTVDGEAITNTQFLLYPRNRYWENGPYNHLVIDPDATELSTWLKERNAVEIIGEWGLYDQTVNTGATVSTTQTASATSLVVSDASDISPGAVLLIENEQELVVETTAIKTYKVVRGVNGTTPAAHVSTKTIYRYIPPYDVNWLCRELAGLAYMKARSNFAGKTGNAEIGEVFYHNEFPSDPIKQLKLNYRIVSL